MRREERVLLGMQAAPGPLTLFQREEDATLLPPEKSQESSLHLPKQLCQASLASQHGHKVKAHILPKR